MKLDALAAQNVANARPDYAGERVSVRVNRLRLEAEVGVYDSERGRKQPLEVSLNSSAPFGQISIDSNSCTMCMSCAAVCPTGSISTEENTPVLNFLEADCVQCGLCEAACPENSITREQRFVFDRNVRDEKRVINKDEPFCCIDCGKPFAPTSTVNMMKEKLKGHSMFAGDAIKRLERCEDCRVKDIYRGLAADPSAQLNL